MMKPAENQPPPYGTFRLSTLCGVFLRGAQNMPVSWLGKRLALCCRRHISSFEWNECGLVVSRIW